MEKVLRSSRSCACYGNAGLRHARLPSLQAGFTLIEMLVVFTILALLLTLATPRYLKTVESGKSKIQAQNLATLRDAIDKFRADQGRYPLQLEEIVTKQYLREVPLDPVSGSRDWVPLPSPNVAQAGIYDVKAPKLTSASLPLGGGSDTSDGAIQPVTVTDPPLPPNSTLPSPAGNVR